MSINSELREGMQDLTQLVNLATQLKRLETLNEYRDVIQHNLLNVRRNALVSQLCKFSPQSPEYLEMIRELDHISYLSHYFVMIGQQGEEAQELLQDAQNYFNNEE